YLFAVDWLLENQLAGSEFARLGGGLAVLAKVLLVALKNAPAAFGTFAQRLLAGEINFRGRRLRFGIFGRAPFAGFGGARLEFETDFATFAHDQISRKRPALLRDELGQQIGPASGEQLLN